MSSTLTGSKIFANISISDFINTNFAMTMRSDPEAGEARNKLLMVWYTSCRAGGTVLLYMRSELSDGYEGSGKHDGRWVNSD